MKLTPLEIEVLRRFARGPVIYLYGSDMSACRRLSKKGALEMRRYEKSLARITPAGRAALAEIDKAKEGQQ